MLHTIFESIFPSNLRFEYFGYYKMVAKILIITIMKYYILNCFIFSSTFHYL